MFSAKCLQVATLQAPAWYNSWYYTGSMTAWPVSDKSHFNYFVGLKSLDLFITLNVRLRLSILFLIHIR